MTEAERDAVCDEYTKGLNYGLGPSDGKPHPLEHEFADQETMEAFEAEVRKVNADIRVQQACGHPGRLAVIRRMANATRRAVVIRRDPEAPVESAIEEIRKATDWLMASDDPLDLTDYPASAIQLKAG
jgi:hypothetical protein